jgi:hypothetical protein
MSTPVTKEEKLALKAEKEALKAEKLIKKAEKDALKAEKEALKTKVVVKIEQKIVEPVKVAVVEPVTIEQKIVEPVKKTKSFAELSAYYNALVKVRSSNKDENITLDIIDAAKRQIKENSQNAFIQHVKSKFTTKEEMMAYIATLL